jgi:hypothetical protein
VIIKRVTVYAISRLSRSLPGMPATTQAARFLGYAGQKVFDAAMVGRQPVPLVMQDDIQQRTVNLQPTVVVYEAHLAEFVHKEIHSAPSGSY